MALITFGNSVVNRSNSTGYYNTCIDLNSSAPVSGIITKMMFYFYTGVNAMYLGTFYGSGTTFTNRSEYNATISAPAGYFELTGLSIPVQVGDYLGFCMYSGQGLEADYNGVAGGMYIQGNAFPSWSGGGAKTYNIDAGAIASIGAEITYISGKKINGVTYTKWNGIAISKWNNI